MGCLARYSATSSRYTYPHPGSSMTPLVFIMDTYLMRYPCMRAAVMVLTLVRVLMAQASCSSGSSISSDPMRSSCSSR